MKKYNIYATINPKTNKTNKYLDNSSKYKSPTNNTANAPKVMLANNCA